MPPQNAYSPPCQKRDGTLRAQTHKRKTHTAERKVKSAPEKCMFMKQCSASVNVRAAGEAPANGPGDRSQPNAQRAKHPQEE